MKYLNRPIDIGDDNVYTVQYTPIKRSMIKQIFEAEQNELSARVKYIHKVFDINKEGEHISQESNDVLIELEQKFRQALFDLDTLRYEIVSKLIKSIQLNGVDVKFTPGDLDTFDLDMLKGLMAIVFPKGASPTLSSRSEEEKKTA